MFPRDAFCTWLSFFLLELLYLVVQRNLKLNSVTTYEGPQRTKSQVFFRPFASVNQALHSKLQLRVNSDLNFQLSTSNFWFRTFSFTWGKHFVSRHSIVWAFEKKNNLPPHRCQRNGCQRIDLQICFFRRCGKFAVRSLCVPPALLFFGRNITWNIHSPGAKEHWQNQVRCRRRQQQQSIAPNYSNFFYSFEHSPWTSNASRSDRWMLYDHLN